VFRSRALQGVENLPCTSGGFRGGVRWGDRTPLRENFFDFSQQKRTKNKFILLRTHLKMCFCLWSHPPSKILDPPLPCTALPGQGRAGYATSKARQGKVTKIFKVQVAGYECHNWISFQNGTYYLKILNNFLIRLHFVWSRLRSLFYEFFWTKIILSFIYLEPLWDDMTR
jgi:hypothetical protein